MTKKKKSAVIIACLLSVLVLGIAAAYVLNKPQVKIRLYRGDRITGTFSMIVNGKEYIPVNKTIKPANGTVQPLVLDGNRFSIKGDEYGEYDFCFDLDNNTLFDITHDTVFKTYPNISKLTISYLHLNQWKITDIKIDTTMNQNKGKWSYSIKITYTETSDDGTSQKGPTTTIYNYSGQDIPICFGM